MMNFIIKILITLIIVSCSKYDSPTTVDFTISYQGEDSNSEIVIYGFHEGKRKFEQKLGETRTSSSKLDAGLWRFSAYYSDSTITEEVLCEETEVFLKGAKATVYLEFTFENCNRQGVEKLLISACEESCDDSPVGSIQVALKTDSGEEMNLGCVKLSDLTSGDIEMNIPLNDDIADQVVHKVFMDGECQEKLEEVTVKELKEEAVTDKAPEDSGREFSFNPIQKKIAIRKKAQNSGNKCFSHKNCGTGFCHPKTKMCVAPTCEDGFKNGDETGADCSGDCDLCATGKGCEETSDCSEGVCEKSKCKQPTCNDGRLNLNETDLDCGGSCSGCDIGQTCLENSDCESKACNAGVCAAPTCSDGFQNGDEGGVDCGGTSCSKCIVGDSCNVGSDCAEGVCLAGTCLAATCNDGVKNSDELDIDCGGSSCAINNCSLGQTCNSNGQCFDNICGVFNTCETAGCNDSSKNDEETDVDCGGPTCNACEDNKICLQASDCQSGKCVGGLCEPPNCSDGIKNNDEGDVDCGGLGCNGVLCEAEKTCNKDYDCISGVCGSDGRCALGCNVVAHKFDLFKDANDWSKVTGSGSHCGIIADARIKAVGSKSSTSDCKFQKTFNLSSAGYSEEQLNSITDVQSHIQFSTISHGNDYYYYKMTIKNNGSILLNKATNGRTPAGWGTGATVHTETLSGQTGVDQFYVLMGGKDKERWAGPHGGRPNQLRFSVMGMPCPSCTDGVQNQDETGVDCGGSCDPCP